MACANHPTVEAGLVRCSRCGRSFCPDCLIRLRGLPYCGECKVEQIRDIQSGTVPGELELATIGRRFSAMWIDGIIGSPLFFLSLFVTPKLLPGLVGNPFFGLLSSVPYFLVVFIYEGLMLQARGQTLGKMAVRIKVVSPEGSPIGPGQAWGRSAVRQAFASCLALVDYLPAFFTKQRTCIHDLAAKTRVVRVRN